MPLTLNIWSPIGVTHRVGPAPSSKKCRNVVLPQNREKTRSMTYTNCQMILHPGQYSVHAEIFENTRKTPYFCIRCSFFASKLSVEMIKKKKTVRKKSLINPVFYACSNDAFKSGFYFPTNKVGSAITLHSLFL